MGKKAKEMRVDDLYLTQEHDPADEPAGLGEDPVDKVIQPVVKEAEQKAAEWIAHLACGINSQNSAALLDTIKDVAGMMGDILVALDPGVKKFDGQFGRVSAGVGVLQPSVLPSNVETFGAQMMTQLTEVLKLQYGPKPIKHDINKLLAALEMAKEMGQDQVAEKLQRKIDSLLESADYAVGDGEVQPALMMAKDLGGYGSGITQFMATPEEKEDAE
ncbi:MAG: hypothetical protein ABIF77_00080 [bacterium]